MSTEEVKTEIGEREAIDRAVQNADHKPEDIAAAFFQMNLGKLKGTVNRMSLRQLKRLIVQVTAYPFIPEEYAPKSQDERTAAYIVSEMLNQKMVMQLAFEAQKIDQAKQTGEVTPETKGEVHE